jgi:hypothetical protein
VSSLPESSLISYLLLSGLVGFGVFCASYGYHVWRCRDAGLKRVDARFPMVRRVAIAAIVIGSVLMGIAALIRDVVRPEGTLVSERTLTVRAPKAARVEYLTERDEIRPGDTVARFRIPEIIGEREQAQYQQQEYEAERAKTSLEPLDLDSDLVRRHQNAIQKQSQLRASRDQVLPARELAARQHIQDRIERLDRLAQIQVDLGVVQGSLEEARRKHAYSTRELARIRQAGRSKAVTESEEDEHRKNVSVLDAEIAKWKRQIEYLQAQQAQLKSSLSALDDFGRRQLALYDRELEQLEVATDELSRGEPEWSEQLALDRQRAERSRQRDLARLEMKVKQSQAKSAAAEARQAVCATIAGKIYFRESAPESAQEDEPLLVVGGPNAFRIRLRLDRRQAAALEHAGTLLVDRVSDPSEPKFAARFYRSSHLALEPGYAIVELACEPPPRTVQHVARGLDVQARLLWRAPLWTIPPFLWGSSVACAGGLALLVIAFAKHRSRETVHRAGRRAVARVATTPSTEDDAGEPVVDRNGHHGNGHADNGHSHVLEYGSVGPILDSLAVRLRQMIARRELDPAVLGAVEWSLDRHHARCVKVLAEAFPSDAETTDMLAALRGDVGERGLYPSCELPHDRFHDSYLRLVRILRVVNPALADELPLER